MTTCTSASSSSETRRAGLEAADFSALDVLAVKLHCLDERFGAPLRQIGVLIGEQIAGEQAKRPLCSDDAFSRLLEACGFPPALTSEFLLREEHRAQLHVTGCAETCCAIPEIGRAACGFNSAVFEGFLRAATGKPWSVQETACLGLGNASCEFLFEVPEAEGAR